jgi:hypothetical protein
MKISKPLIRINQNQPDHGCQQLTNYGYNHLLPDFPATPRMVSKPAASKVDKAFAI